MTNKAIAGAVRTVDMGLVSTDTNGGKFNFEMQAQHNVARNVKFSIDQIDARRMYEALVEYLQISTGK